ncbi:hypothetical protein CMK11_14105 [Candidatus Poribacteria bacterium]|nr:hypothetical protein [Candidatus Poribacteria bacterium]
MSGPHVAILESDEWDRYRAALGYVTELAQQVAEETAALERTNYLIRGADLLRVQIWRDLCDAHGLDAEVDYAVDEAGRVSVKSGRDDA